MGNLHAINDNGHAMFSRVVLSGADGSERMAFNDRFRRIAQLGLGDHENLAGPLAIRLEKVDGVLQPYLAKRLCAGADLKRELKHLAHHYRFIELEFVEGDVAGFFKTKQT